MYYKTLNNNVKMPQVGFGVFQTPVDETKRAVLDAIEVGYRSFDTAQIYGNEAGVGEAILESGLPREEFFITTKIWISNAGFEKAKASIEESLKKLQTDYIDLLLVHQPVLPYYKLLIS
jgi:2,5-diketo-D-gluconate reductase A